MAIYHEDIVSIDLESGTIYRSFMNHAIGYGDDDANRFGIRAYRNGVAETLGGTCAGYFIRADGATVTIADGVVSGNLAYVTLPEACYAVEGNFTLAIKVSGSGVTGTMRIVDGVVSRTSTSATVDPGTIIPSVEDLIDAIENAVASVPAEYDDVWTTFAPNFSSSTAYKTGQYVTYDGALYRFIKDHEAGTWAAEDVENADVGGDIYDFKNDLNYLNLHGKVIDAFINFAEKTIIRNDGASKTIFIPCLPNTKYTVAKTAGTRFVIAATDSEPVFNGTNFGTIISYEYDHTASRLTLITPPTAKYLCAWVWQSTDSIGADAMIDSVMLYPEEHNNNLWDGDKIVNAYIDADGGNVVSSDNARTIYIKCKPNTKYRITKTAGARFAVAATVSTPANGVDILSCKNDNTAGSIEYITPANAAYMCTWVYLSTADTTITAGEMLASCSIVEEGESGNLWDGTTQIDAYVDWGNMAISSKNSYSVTVYVPCEERKLYKVKKTAGQRFVIGTTASAPTYGTAILNYAYDNTASELIIFTPPGAKYLCAWVYLSTADTGITSEKMLASVYITKNIADILFWGDSLTAGAGGNGTTYPGVCAAELGKTHINCGVGGETANTISARQGGNNVIIPAGAINGTYNNGELLDMFGAEVSPLRQGNGSFSGNMLFIKGILCSLSISQTSATSDDAVYTISGYTGGTSNVPLLGKFIGAEYDAHVVVIFVGQNGSWYENTNNLENRIAIIDSMIAHVPHKRYVIVGLTSGTSSRATEEETLTKKYGSKYMASRALLVAQGLTIAGVAPTTQDTTDIANGTVPTSLRSDEVHLNANGYMALGKLVADKIRALGYFE